MSLQIETGLRLKEVRKLLGVSQLIVAEKIGLQQSRLSAIEKGKGNLTADNLRALNENFEISTDWLLTGKGDPIIVSKEQLYKEAIVRFVDNITRAANADVAAAS